MNNREEGDCLQIVEKGFIAAESYRFYHFKGAFQFDPNLIWAPTFCLFHVREKHDMVINIV